MYDVLTYYHNNDGLDLMGKIIETKSQIRVISDRSRSLHPHLFTLSSQAQVLLSI